MILRASFITLFLTGASSAMSGTIHTGSDKGSYFNAFCPSVIEAIEKHHFNHQCATSSGTVDNIEKVRITPTDVGIGQLDIAAGATDLEVIDPDPGLGFECMFAVTNNESVRNLFDLSSRIPLALPGKGSGSEESFRRLQKLDKGLGSLRNITYYKSAYRTVESVVNGEAEIAYFVQFPDKRNPVFKLINDNNLSFVPVISRPILRQNTDGVKHYEAMDVNVTPASLLSKANGVLPKIKTSCTPIVVFTGKLEGLEGDAKADQELLIESLRTTQRPESDSWFENLSKRFGLNIVW